MENIASQNKYVYTLNNPYKYVDRNGQKSVAILGAAGVLLKKTKKPKKTSINIIDDFLSIQNKFVSPQWKAASKEEAKAGIRVEGKVSSSSSKGGGSSKKKKATTKKAKVKTKCPDKKKSNSDDNLFDSIHNILDAVGWCPWIIGDFADGLNAFIYFLQGLLLMCSINIMCLVLPAAVMAGAKKIGKACSGALEFVSKLSKEAQKMGSKVKKFIYGIGDTISNFDWLLGEKRTDFIKKKLKDFGNWIYNICQEALQKRSNKEVAEEAIEETGESALKGASGTKVTNSLETQASINKKLETYLLDKNHIKGGSKAEWFDKALGYNQSNMDGLAKQIVFDPKTAIQTNVTQYGVQYNQLISITGANGKVIDVTFAWIRNEDGIIRLVTAIPTKK